MIWRERFAHTFERIEIYIHQQKSCKQLSVSSNFNEKKKPTQM